MNRLVIVVMVSIFVALSAQAQDLKAQFIEGLVEVQRGAAWVEISTGDTVPAAAVVRLDDGAFAELASSATTLRLAKRGTYDLGKLALANAQTKASGVGSFLTQRAKAMGSQDDPSKRGTTVAGVRGAAATAGELKWAGGETTDELITQGLSKLSAGQYKEAISLFQEARDSAPGPGAARATFYLGYAAYLNGDVPVALRNLRTPAPDPTSKEYNDHVLVLAQVLVETFAYADASSLLQGYLKGSPSGDNLQTAQLLLGLSEKGLGNRDKAAASLKAAQQQNPSSSAGVAAAKILESL